MATKSLEGVLTQFAVEFGDDALDLGFVEKKLNGTRQANV